MSSKTSRKTKDSKSPAKAKSSKAHSPDSTKEREASWSLRLYDTRQWGQRLNRNGGSDPLVVKRLLKTLQDPRAPFEGALRRTTVENLTAAAAVGHRGALTAQTAALADTSEVVRRAALECLGASAGAAAGSRRAEAGGAVAVALTEALPRGLNLDDDVEVRRTRAAALLQLAPRGDKDLASIAASWLDDTDALVRTTSLRALGAIGESSATVKTVAERLTDPNWHVRQAAVQALERLSTATGRLPGAKVSVSEPPPDQTNLPVPTVVDKLVRPTSGRSTASDGKKSKAEQAKAKAEKLAATLEARRANAEAAAIGALARSCSEGSLIGLQRAEALASLRIAAPPDASGLLEAGAARLTDTDPEVRHEAERLLATLEDAELTAHAAMGHLAHRDFRVRAAAQRALQTAVAAAPDTAARALSRTAAALESSDWAGRRGVGRSLRQLGEGCAGSGLGLSAALSTLLPRLRHTDWSIRRKAVQAVAEVAEPMGGSERAVSLLTTAAADADEDVRLAAAKALPLAAPKKSRSAVCLAAQLATEDPKAVVRVCALEAMEALASEERSRSRTAVHAVVRCLEDESMEVRVVAARVLRSIGRDRRTTVDALAACLEHRDEGVRTTAAGLFEIVRGRDDRVHKRVIKLLQNDDPGVREAARTAMGSLAQPHESNAIAVAAGVLNRLRILQNAPPPPPPPEPVFESEGTTAHLASTTSVVSARSMASASGRSVASGSVVNRTPKSRRGSTTPLRRASNASRRQPLDRQNSGSTIVSAAGTESSGPKMQKERGSSKAGTVVQGSEHGGLTGRTRTVVGAGEATSVLAEEEEEAAPIDELSQSETEDEGGSAAAGEQTSRPPTQASALSLPQALGWLP